MQLPQLCEGWSWRVTRPVVVSEDAKGNRVEHKKVFIELLLHDDVRRRATIDVGMYGDGAAVVERARAMSQSVAAEQLAGLVVTQKAKSQDTNDH